MKKILITLLLVLVFALSACSGSTTTAATQVAAAATQVQTASDTIAAAALSTSYTNALPVASQLLIGTFELEGTGLAVTADQAVVLLPLWNSYLTLNQGMGPGATQGNTTSSTDALTQIDAVLAQIQAAMTSAQLQAIAALQITGDSAQTILSDQGITMTGPGGTAGGQPQGAPSTTSALPQGTPPAAMGSGNGAQPGAMGGGFPPEVTSALIQLLQKRSGAAASSTSASSASASSGAAPMAPGGSSAASISLSGAFILDGTSANESGKTYAASAADQSAILVSNGGALSLTKATVTKSGDSSSTDNSSFYGLNAAVLAASGSSLSLSDSTVTSNGVGANGVFSTGSGSSVTLSNVTINASGDGAHAVMATQGGSMTLTGVSMTSTGASSSAIATDRGGGTITVTGGTVQTSGMNSAGIYSTGNITVTGTTFTSTGAEAAVIEGANSITLTDVSMTSTKAGKWGVMIYQSMSGDAQGTEGTFTMAGGSLADTASDSPLFYVTNSTAVITLKGVSLNAASGTLVNAAAGSWGNSGTNSGTVNLIADSQTLTGNFAADSISVFNLTLQNGSSLTGAINAARTAKSATLSLDATSKWTVSANSYLSTLADASGISGMTVTNIVGNGHSVYYDASNAVNSTLKGLTYSLVNGGQLTPLK